VGPELVLDRGGDDRDDLVDLRVREAVVDGQRDLVLVQPERDGEVGDVEAALAEERQHRQRHVVDIDADLGGRDPVDDPIAHRLVGARDPQQVQVSGRLASVDRQRRENRPRSHRERRLVPIGDAPAIGQQLGQVLADLREPDRRVDVREVDLEAEVDDVVAPGPRLVLLERGLRLPVEGEGAQARQVARVVERLRQVEADRSTFARRDVLDRVQ